MNEILVSVVVLAYNHEAFIRDALEGIIHQKADFKYEVIVHDDASTDRTAQIIREYEEKHSGLLRVLYETENQFGLIGGPSAVKNILKRCKGKYITICEGDDFWIDNHKLRIQADWMESHPDYFMSAHNALMIDYKNNSFVTMNPYISEKEISQEELIMQYNGGCKFFCVYGGKVLLVRFRYVQYYVGS